MRKILLPIVILASVCLIWFALGKAGLEDRFSDIELMQDNYAKFPEISAPSGNPTSNWGWLYVKDQGSESRLYFEDDVGIAHNVLQTDTVELSNAEIKALRASPKTLVAAPGANKFLELVSAVLILDYGSEALTESDDDLVIEYASNTDATATIECTGFIDQTADTMAVIPATTIASAAASNISNQALRLFNDGDGEFGGNASNDTTMTVKISYRIHTDGL